MSKGKYCGSMYGGQLHRKNGEPVCEPCRVATNEVNRRSREKNREKERLRHAQYRARLKAQKKKVGNA